MLDSKLIVLICFRGTVRNQVVDSLHHSNKKYLLYLNSIIMDNFIPLSRKESS